MHDEGRPHYRRRSRSRDRHDQYHRSRSPRGRGAGDDGEQDYYRSRKEKDDSSPGYRRPHQAYDSSLPYDDESRHSRSRSPTRRQQHGPGRPSATIIVDGLPSDATEDDLLDGFARVSPDTRVFHADSVKAVRLRGTNKRGHRTFAFVEFFSVNDAAHFLEFHYPSLEFPLAPSRGVDSELVAVSINYSRGREDEGTSAAERGWDERGRDRDDGDWKCSECAFTNYGSRTRCLRCRTAKSDGYDAMSYGPRLTGETDECPQQFPSQYLVIRGLDPSINESLFADGVKKLYVEAKPEPKKETQNKLKSTAPTANTARLGARPDSLRRVFLVRDKQTDEGMRYGFAEFATLEDAQGAIAKFKASPNITISLKPVTVAFIHTGVFIPHTGRVTEENSRYIFNPIYNRDIFLKYWDNRVYPSILRVTDDVETVKRPSADDAGSTEKPSSSAADELTTVTDASGKKIKKFKLGPSVPKPAPVMAPQMQMWAKKRAELVGKAPTDVDDRLEPSPAPSERPVVPSKRSRPKDTYTSFADTEQLSCMLCLRKFESLLALRDHEALNKEHQASRHDEEKRNTAIEKLRALGKRPRQMTIRVVNTSHMPSDRIYTSYADTENLHCLICQRKFSKLALLSLHERESEMHRINMTEQPNLERAISQLARTGKTPRKMVPGKNKGTQYRDRAKERRQAFKQPNAPRRKALADQPLSDVEPDKTTAPSKGAALLGKMGWLAGEGLGADKAGRTDVIATDVYAAGVGLGAEGAKLGDAAEEAARKTKDNYTDFVEVTRNKARQRYERLG